jgi:bacteriocin-like protein
MSNNSQNEYPNASLAQGSDQKNDDSCREDKALIENEAIAEPLSTEELANVSGGASEEVVSRLVGKRTSTLEPEPTFPAPPRSEDSP